MRIAFLETLGWDMNVETPFLRPLGGTQSAACYLAITMATAGHEVFFVSVNGSPGRVRGVNCLPFEVLDSGELAALRMDVLVVLMKAHWGRKLRWVLGEKMRLVLWTGGY